MAGEKLLLVDDEKIVREAFVAAFNEYTVITAGSGQEALNILGLSSDIDLVILDLAMPGLSGIQLLKEIKKINPEPSIVIVSGYSSKDIPIEVMCADIVEFIEKPFDIEQMRGVIERLLNSK